MLLIISHRSRPRLEILAKPALAPLARGPSSLGR